MALTAQSGGHSKHALAVHLIWVVKYRRSVLTHEIGDRVKAIVSEVAAEIGVEIIKIDRHLLPFPSSLSSTFAIVERRAHASRAASPVTV